jgi:predicted nucleic acid-binding protein
MLLVICDATPLIYLAKIGRFQLLHALHEQVLVPTAVWQEVAIQGAFLPEGQSVRQAADEGWLRVEKPTGKLALNPEEMDDLDAGEEEAIQLALEKSALLVIDEARGRIVAQRLGLKITGTVGLLLRAHREGCLPELRKELDKLRTETTFRMSQRLYEDVLRAAGEGT